MNKHNICNNCGKQGHQFHQCKLPVISYGIIAFRLSAEFGIQYLMIRRKNSFGYIDFIRGKYMQHNFEHLQSIFNEMSIDERLSIKNNNFETLWKNMWGIQETNNTAQYKVEELASHKKFESLKNGLQIGPNNELVTLDTLIDNATTNWPETEWEFPKGRRNFQEKDLDCALREFEEETGISKKSLKVVENLFPLEELFLGSNHKSYKHKYFLGYTEYTTDDLNNYQQTEVSKIEWKTLDECLKAIRPYHLEKKQLINNIDRFLREYKLY